MIGAQQEESKWPESDILVKFQPLVITDEDIETTGLNGGEQSSVLGSLET